MASIHGNIKLWQSGLFLNRQLEQLIRTATTQQSNSSWLGMIRLKVGHVASLQGRAGSACCCSLGKKWVINKFLLCKSVALLPSSSTLNHSLHALVHTTLRALSLRLLSSLDPWKVFPELCLMDRGATGIKDQATPTGGHCSLDWVYLFTRAFEM
jgi:hypothetical protein